MFLLKPSKCSEFFKYYPKKERLRYYSQIKEGGMAIGIGYNDIIKSICFLKYKNSYFIVFIRNNYHLSIQDFKFFNQGYQSNLKIKLDKNSTLYCAKNHINNQFKYIKMKEEAFNNKSVTEIINYLKNELPINSSNLTNNILTNYNWAAYQLFIRSRVFRKKINFIVANPSGSLV